MKLARLLIVGYAVIAVSYAAYAHWWGDGPTRTFSWHLGQGLFWPAMVIPGLREVLTAVVILVVIALITKK